MRAPESHVLFLNAAAGTVSGVCLYGGTYVVLLDCTGTPALQLYAMNASGNYVAVGSAFVTAGGGSFEVDLPPGLIRAIIATSTANTLTLARVPEE